jgi:hypothetical protein
MEQLTTPHQILLGSFPHLSQAEAAVDALEKAEFDKKKLSLMPKEFQPDPPVPETEADRGARGGLLAGTVFGAIAGLVMGYMTTVSPGGPAFDGLSALVGITLAGAGIGAAGGGLIGVLSGVQVGKSASELQGANQAGEYVIVAEQMAPDEVMKAKELLKSLGGVLEV